MFRSQEFTTLASFFASVVRAENGWNGLFNRPSVYYTDTSAQHRSVRFFIAAWKMRHFGQSVQPNITHGLIQQLTHLNPGIASDDQQSRSEQGILRDPQILV